MRGGTADGDTDPDDGVRPSRSTPTDGLAEGAQTHPEESQLRCRVQTGGSQVAPHDGLAEGAQTRPEESQLRRRALTGGSQVAPHYGLAESGQVHSEESQLRCRALTGSPVAPQEGAQAGCSNPGVSRPDFLAIVSPASASPQRPHPQPRVHSPDPGQLASYRQGKSEPLCSLQRTLSILWSTSMTLLSVCAVIVIAYVFPHRH